MIMILFLLAYAISNHREDLKKLFFGNFVRCQGGNKKKVQIFLFKKCSGETHFPLFATQVRKIRKIRGFCKLDLLRIFLKQYLVKSAKIAVFELLFK